MDLSDKMENVGDDIKGKGKEAAGKARGDKSQEFEGKADQVKSDAKDIGDNVRDALGRNDD
jgi:uncharacterized protein YjbJ (UPF0337 family)